MQVISAVADELARPDGAEATFVTRVEQSSGERGEPEEYTTIVGSFGRVAADLPVGLRIEAVARSVHHTRPPIRAPGAGPGGALLARVGMRVAVATAIVVGPVGSDDRRSLCLELRLAQSTVPGDLPDLDTEIGLVADELNDVVEDLREIARGIHPAILSEGGLGPALRTLARRAAIPVELDITAIARPPEPIEVAAYYVVSEALTNATRHVDAQAVHVAVEEQDDRLHLSIRDDGVGGADTAKGSGLIGLRDRTRRWAGRSR